MELRRTVGVVTVAVSVAAVFAGGCSSAAEDGAGSAVDASGTVADGPAVVEGPSIRESLDQPTDDAEAIGTVVSIAPVPETGVAGIDADDAFCQAWSRFAGSFQGLAVVTDGGRPPDEHGVLEIGAADAIVDAVADLDQHFPDDAAEEHDAFVDGYVGPLARRAELVLAAAAGAGLDADALDALGAAWLAAITEQGVTDPGLDLVVPAGVDTAVLALAAGAVTDTVPSMFDDPSLVIDVNVDATLDHIVTSCPDHGTLGGLDIVGP